MIETQNGTRIVTNLSELPDFSGCKKLYLDCETTGDNPEGNTYAYKGSRIAGIAVTVDDHEGAWYLPIAHRKSLWNLPRDNVASWVRDVFKNDPEWINHNVKFDAHFISNEMCIDLSKTRMIDTLVGAKMIDSDRGYGTPGYALDELSADWLGQDISRYTEKIRAFLDGIKLPRNRKCHDYGRIPPDLLGEYAGQDVITNRLLYEYIESHMPEESAEAWRVEKALTPVLFDMEKFGMRVDPSELEELQYQLQYSLIKIEEQIADLVGAAYNPGSPADMYDLICNYFGLPVLGWTEEGNPSFNKDAMKKYSSHPDVISNPKCAKVIKLIDKYKKNAIFLSLFVETYLNLNVNGVLHPSYNQSVRTARMSCREPNAQQLNKRAKKLIRPPEGYGFMVWDYSQMEFRLIVHYAKDIDPINAYRENPDTCFHTWVAQMCGIKRRPAKNVNFCIAFGGGKKKVLSMLAVDMDLVGSLMADVDTALDKMSKEEIAKCGGLKALRQSMFEKACTARAKEVFEQYHDRLPGVQNMTDKCSFRAKSRGYIKNIAGRHRHLRENACWRAFNAVIQSSAADIMKRQLVAISPRYNEWVRERGIIPAAVVHDSVKCAVPQEHMNADVSSAIAIMLECVDFNLRVPLRATAGMAMETWAHAEYDGEDPGTTDNRVKVNREQWDYFKDVLDKALIKAKVKAA